MKVTCPWVALTLICIPVFYITLYWRYPSMINPKPSQPNITGENMKPLENLDICVFVDIERTVELCPDSPSTIGSPCNGGFGNQISSLATLFAFSKKYGVRPVIHGFQKEMLERFFENVNVPIFMPELDKTIPKTLDIHLKGKEDSTFNRYFRTFLEKLPNFLTFTLSLRGEGVVSGEKDESLYYDTILENPQPYIKGKFLTVGVYPNAFFLYRDYLEEIKEEFKIKSEYLEYARETLRNIGERYTGKNVIYVGVHFRRTSYEDRLKKVTGEKIFKYTGERFFDNGVKEFRSKFGAEGEVVFVVLTDDMPWALKHLQHKPGVFIGSYRAKAKSSSQINPLAKAVNVVDGIRETTDWPDQFISQVQAFPWLEIDLDSLTGLSLDRVVVYPRGDCCQERFGNFQVRLGTESLSQNLLNKTEQLNTVGYLCGQVENNITTGEPAIIHCKNPSKFRYIFIQGTKKWMSLELSEVIWLGPGEELRGPNEHVSRGATRDFALLSLCNHSLITYGTYGQWAAIYAGGHTIMPIGYAGNNTVREITEIQRANMTNWSFMHVDKEE